MLPTASHAISVLTEGAPVSDVEAGVWTKIMKKTVQMKIKVTNATVKVLTLRKLCDIGTTTVEEFVRREVKGESRREQVKVVKLFHQRSEDELGDSEERWEEYLEGVNTITRLIQDLRKKVEALESDENISEEKVEDLDDLQTLNKSHTNKVVCLLATGTGLTEQLPENEVSILL